MGDFLNLETDKTRKHSYFLEKQDNGQKDSIFEGF